MKPVRVDVIAYAPTAFFHCGHCEVTFQQMGIGARMRRMEAAESLPPDLQLEYLDLSEWIHRLSDRYRDRITVRVIDAASLPGVWVSLRHRVRSYPAVRVGGLGEWVRLDQRAVESVIDRLVGEEAEATPGSPR